MASEKERNKVIEQAEKYVKKGKLLEAVKVYEKLITGDEQDIHIRNTIGDLYLKADNKNKAIEQYKVIAEYCEKKGLSSKAIAILKKISKLDPENTQVSIQLADLYSSQGFLTEAKGEYIKTAKTLANSNRRKEAIPLFEKALVLSPTDIGARLILAELYSKENMVEQAVEMLNEVAELKIKKDQVKEAEEILNLARDLKEDDFRTLKNLIGLYEKNDRRQEAYGMVQDTLKNSQDNVSLLNLLGNLYFEDEEYDKSEDVYSKVFGLRPNDVQARTRLGALQIHKGDLDKAFEFFEPIATSLLKKKRLDKAVGLLGLIVLTKNRHLPTLKKLGDIFRTFNETQAQETVYRLILEEYKNQNRYAEALEAINALSTLYPDDETRQREFKKMSAEITSKAGKPVPKEEKKEPEKTEPSEEAGKSASPEEPEETIKKELAKVDLYMDQGLERNALKLLDSLRTEYPKNHLVKEKIAAVMAHFDKGASEVAEQISEMESMPETPLSKEEFQAKMNEIPEDALKEGEDEKITAAEIFADTDMLPYESQIEEKEFYNLKDQVKEEHEAIKNAIMQQMKGSMTPGEKELSDIVTQFKAGVKEKVDEADHESRYNLGIAFMEQGLYDEAVEELKLAAKDSQRTLECYIIISFCYRQKREVENALKWMKKAMDISDPEATQVYDLKFEMASIYEELGVVRKAMDLYQEVKEWDSRYRGVSKRIAKLKDSRQA